MAFNGSKITPPITDSDLKYALGDSSNDVKLLFQSNGINKWSRVKPIPYKGNGDISFDTDLSTTKGLIWGMKPPKALASDGLKLNGMVKTTMVAPVYDNWVYVSPIGGIDEPFRSGDFKGYNAAAQCPIAMGISNYMTSVNLFDNNYLTFYIHSNPSASDFPNVSSFASGLYNYYLVSEWYDSQGGNTPYYEKSNWDYKYKSDIPLQQMTSGDGYIYQVDISSFENKTFDICMAIQKYEGGAYIAQSAILPPWTAYDYPYLKSVSFFSAFTRQTNNFYVSYSTNTSIPWRACDTASSNEITINGYSDLVIKFDIQLMERSIYMIRPMPSSVPSGAKQVMFKALTMGEGYNNGNEAIGTPIDPNTRQTMANGFTLINSGSEFQTVALNFQGLIKQYGKINMIYIFYSVDGGSTWSNNPCASASISITRGT